MPPTPYGEVVKARAECLRLLRAFAKMEGKNRSVYSDLAELITAACKMIEVEKRHEAVVKEDVV